MNKVLLDGYGIKLKAIRGEVDTSCPYDQEVGREGYSEIVIETDKGNFFIHGCSQCYVLSWFIEKGDSDET